MSLLADDNQSDRSADAGPWALSIDLSRRNPEVRLGSGVSVVVLVIEDGPDSSDSLTALLNQRGFTAVSSTSKADTARQLDRPGFHVVLIDAAPGGRRGSETSVAVRAQSQLPICLVTPSDDEIEVVLSLELGADAVMRRPVRPQELLARLVSLARRLAPRDGTDEHLRSGNLEIDPIGHRALLSGMPLALNGREFALLALLLKNSGRALTRDYLVERLWGFGDRGTFKVLSSHIQRLRELIEADPDNPMRLMTIRGYGYRFVPAPSAPSDPAVATVADAASVG